MELAAVTFAVVVALALPAVATTVVIVGWRGALTLALVPLQIVRLVVGKMLGRE